MPWWIERTRRLRRHLGRLEVWELERFGRSGLSVVSRQSVLVLATTGRRSGQTRKTPVTYLPYEGGFLIGGGAGGQRATPDWVYNLRAGGPTRVTVNRVAHEVTIDEPTGAARDRAMATMLAAHPSISRYEQWGDRPLPLFVLRPT